MLVSAEYAADRPSAGGLVRFFVEESPSDPRSLAEAFEDGWWYTAGLPGAQCVVMLMTDADIARRLRLHEPCEWSRRLAATGEVSKRINGLSPLGRLRGRPADSRRLEPPVGGGAMGAWLAVGDAASVFDPLSSQGIVKALRSGIFASYVLADFLTKGDEAALIRYQTFVESEFASYLGVRERYCREVSGQTLEKIVKISEGVQLVPVAGVDQAVEIG